VEVVLVYRERYRDWTFPKGKVEEGETDEQAALREVEEETGLRCELGEELARTRYRDPKLRAKVVRYWAMTPVAGEAGARHEIDDLVWLPIPGATERLTHERDRDVLRSLGPVL
jgi:8-oxo-dGTP diphosphatase